MSKRVSVAARCPSGPLEIEPWTGRSEIDGQPERFVVLRVTSNGRGRLWLMIDLDAWEELNRLVYEKLSVAGAHKG